MHAEKFERFCHDRSLMGAVSVHTAIILQISTLQHNSQANFNGILKTISTTSQCQSEVIFVLSQHIYNFVWSK